MMTLTLPFAIFGSITAFYAAIIYQGNLGRKHKPWNIVSTGSYISHAGTTGMLLHRNEKQLSIRGHVQITVSIHTGMITIAKGLESRITLADGNSMPMFGLGMFESSGIKAEKAVEYALSQGYRLFDTAEFHGIEEDIGRGIEKSGINRKEIFVVNKLWENGYDRCKQVFMESLRKTKLNYIDLYCIHNPTKGNNVETYKAMIELQEQGIIKSLGVSNFGVHHLEAFKSAGLPTPVVNQIELHPWQQKTEIVNYCRTNGIALMGYSPLCKGRKFNNKLLIDIAKRYKRSAPQILIRWSVQHGFVTIPKSSDQRHIETNANVFDWSLKQEDIELMVRYQYIIRDVIRCQ